MSSPGGWSQGVQPRCSEGSGEPPQPPTYFSLAPRARTTWPPVKPETPVTATGPSSGEIGAMLKMCQVCLPPARCNKVRAPSSAAQSEGEASSCRGSPDVRWRLVVQVRGRATRYYSCQQFF